MHMDPMMPYFVGGIAAILILGIILRRFNQPHVVAYLVAGALLGPSGLGFIDDREVIVRLGEIGVVLLLFFAGMEFSLPSLLSRWKVPVVGTFLQIAVSMGATIALGYSLGWPLARGVLLGFVISLSSTGVVLKLLRDRNETDETVGGDVVGILLVQDIAIVPMLITINLLGGESPSLTTVLTQALGGIAVILLLVFVARHPTIRLPFGHWLRSDHELQVFSAFLIAFGFALLSGAAGLSTALGAFVAGIVVGAAKETEWVHQALHSFYVLLLAFFFVSVGMLLDFGFLFQNAAVVGGLLIAVLLSNTLINACILRVLGRNWKDSLYGGTLLAQVGEFSFVLAAVGQQTGYITDVAHKIVIGVIALSLLASPFWIGLGRWLRQKGGATSATTHLRPEKTAI